MLTFPRRCEVELTGGGQGNVPYYTLVGGHIGFQRRLQPQMASDIKCAIFILDGWISDDALRNFHKLGILLGPLIPCYINVLWVEPT